MPTSHNPHLWHDNWYHVWWVWRDTPDCSTNHDLSYMKSPDLKELVQCFWGTCKIACHHPEQITDSGSRTSRWGYHKPFSPSLPR